MPLRSTNRHSPVLLAACFAAASFSFSSAQAQSPSASGNPINTLPTFQPLEEPSDKANVRILDTPLPTQPRLARNVTPQRFAIEGVKSIPFAKVAALFAPLAKQPTTVAKLADLARQVTDMYKENGYALSFAYVPEQDFKDGTVRVIAVEGFVDTVKIEGDAGPAAARIREIAQLIQQNRPLQLANFERYTQLMGQLPGLTVEALATPPAQTNGAGSMLVKVARKPYELSLGADIRSSRPRAVLTGIVNDPLMAGSRLSATTLLGSPKGEFFGSLAYSQVIGNEGLTLKSETTAYRGDPDAHLNSPPPIRRYTDYLRSELSASYPVILKRGKSLYLSSGIYGVNNTDTYTTPTQTLTDQVNVRAVYAQAAYSIHTDVRARNLSLRLAQGMDALGASASRIRTSSIGSSTASVNPASLDFTRVLLDATQRNVWGQGWGTAMAFTTQYSPDILPNSEKMSFGSTRFARGYNAGDASGDSGWGIGLEGNRSFPVKLPYVTHIEPYVLLESARVYNHIGQAQLSKLSSASLGARLSNGKYYRIDFAVSKPIGDAPSTNPERKLRMSLLASYSLGN
jgi:hemolysin activation/secretion protein